MWQAHYPNAVTAEVHEWPRQFERQRGSTSHHRSGGLAVASGGGAMDGGAMDGGAGASVPPPKPPF